MEKLLNFLIIAPYAIYRMGLRLIYGKEKRNKKYRGKREHYLSVSFKFLPTQIVRKLILSFFSPNFNEPKVVKFIKKTNGKMFIDVGANIGFYPLLLANQYNKIVAIEPEPQNLIHLKNNTKRYPNIIIKNCAISDQNGYQKLFLNQFSSCHSLLPNLPYYNKLSIKVETRTLSTLFPTEHIDLVKVDVEGAELQVLQGALNIMQNIKSWMIEVHDLNQKPVFEKLLKSYGYEFRWLNSHHVYAKRKLRERNPYVELELERIRRIP